MRQVLVTGAGGFLGGWVVESFMAAGIPVRAGIRRWASAVRLGRHAGDIVPCDVLSREQLALALEGCDAVVHCAVGNERVTVEGTRNLLDVARQQNVDRIVHISSVAVYGKADGRLTESSPRRSRGNEYARCKIGAEEVCEEFVQRGSSVVVLRPSIIYGPFSDAWTVSFAKRLLSGRWGTFGTRGEGFCNLAYVTDVVQAIYRALATPQASGAVLNISGPDVITWNEYFQRFNRELGRPALEELNVRPMAMKARLYEPVRTIARFARARFHRSVMQLHARSPLAARYMGATESTLKLMPTREQLKLYGVKAEYDISRAQEVLGYIPQVDSAQGLRLSVQWLKQQGFVKVPSTPA